MITFKTEEQIEKMRAAGALLYSVLQTLKDAAAPGTTTLELDRLAERLIREGGAVPSFKGYEGFPYSICASVDAEVVHGFASDKKLRRGQLLSIDCGVLLDGWQSDSALTVVVGGGNAAAQQLIDVTEQAFWHGAEMAQAGNRLGDVSSAIQQYAEAHGCGVVRELTGHGIGTEMHEDPAVPNYGRAGRGVLLKKGMTIAIEPMLTLGRREVMVMPNHWTYVTRDGSYAAHYEHTICITDGAPEILSYPGASVAEAIR